MFEITVIKLLKKQTLYVMNICSESLNCKLIYEKDRMELILGVENQGDLQ